MGADESPFIHSLEQFKVYTCSCLNRQKTWPGNEHTKAVFSQFTRGSRTSLPVIFPSTVVAPLVTRYENLVDGF